MHGEVLRRKGANLKNRPPSAKLPQCQQILIRDPRDDGPRSLEPRLV